MSAPIEVDWKNAHANAAGEALKQALVVEVIAELMENLGIEDRSTQTPRTCSPPGRP